MTKVINSNNKNFEEDFNDLLIMNRSSDTNVTETVSSIIADIRNDGDDALLKYTHQFDKNELTIEEIVLDEEEINKQSANITDDLCNALNVSMERVRDYHKKQLPEDLIFEDDLNLSLIHI